jgi:transposase
MDGPSELDSSTASACHRSQKVEGPSTTSDLWTLEIVKRSDAAKGFERLPWRWVVERTIAWLNRNRHLAKGFEATIASAVAWIFIASVKLLSRRVAWT